MVTCIVVSMLVSFGEGRRAAHLLSPSPCPQRVSGSTEDDPARPEEHQTQRVAPWTENHGIELELELPPQPSAAFGVPDGPGHISDGTGRNDSEKFRYKEGSAEGDSACEQQGYGGDSSSKCRSDEEEEGCGAEDLLELEGEVQKRAQAGDQVWSTLLERNARLGGGRSKDGHFVCCKLAREAVVQERREHFDMSTATTLLTLRPQSERERGGFCYI